ncbi:hypothetical protein APHWI1_1323 [Anaplasma phagocytophilum str. ApWI1]|uniref:Uncharacterized protein n=2 Tax=Anaplasma phagocytophilum TaxID=948 RepID=A0A0F3NJG0_ANAPH|nr:hypothetical protein APHWEB_0197 [Anaplasma phagocytophilum str. Webster]KJV68150.1 hypothetical protein EPHNCH_0538 [Anaplasma phagocytophilum str. NCH-1]KJV83139.1 hypothetical protein APHHGE2_0547 [Anaplasma phagocytophilum str. HGE2]KJV85357.1 hypothetical protein APHWI1_1323 [Anaplasma phagocytophilum str. ApWI1]KJV88194.1 hypothetical protein APHNYW_0274 [Anaplasma phagocytophilum str. ApNYW]KJV99269.1 hypothetical protein OTSANNIE_0520 [Anaplasma phagocytophilum str. Annie]KJZ99987.
MGSVSVLLCNKKAGLDSSRPLRAFSRYNGGYRLFCVKFLQ